jgi:CheY-like chemotaxis protein
LNADRIQFPGAHLHDRRAVRRDCRVSAGHTASPSRCFARKQEVELIRKRVLVVEDEAMASMLLEDMLQSLGCEVVGVAARLEAAQKQAQVATIDVATLDVNLAGQMSYPVALILRSRDIPFVFATGYRSLALPPELKDATVLSKPYSLSQLAGALLQSLSENAALRQRDLSSAPVMGQTKSV